MKYKNLLKRRKKQVLPSVNIKELNDHEVLTRSLAEPNAFEEIVNRYQRLFVRKAREITGNEDDAYDVVQETFVRIYAGAKRFKAENVNSFKSWAYTILTRQCYTHYNKQKRLAQVNMPLSQEMIEVIPDSAEKERYEHALSMENALALVSKLPEKLKHIVELYFIQGTSQKEIALREHLSPVAVRVRIHRAKRELQRLNLESNIMFQ